MPRLETTTGWSRLKSDMVAIVSPRTGSASVRLSIARSVLLRSVRISFGPTSATTPPIVPLRVRPAFVLLNVIDLIFLGILGFHPSGQTWLRINDKILHFICFLFATALFYMIWDVDEQARGSWLWRHASLILTFCTCFVVGGIGSEIVQSLLPYKVFQLGDIIANLLGSSLGLFFSYHVEKKYRARREIERLYAPLDIEDYGDLEDEEDPDEDLGAARGSKSLSQSEQAAAAKKKVRFGNEIWDDSVEIQPLRDISNPPSQALGSSSSHSTTNQQQSQPAPSQREQPESHSSAAKPVSKENLFAIDDEDDDEENAWKDATRS